MGNDNQFRLSPDDLLTEIYSAFEPFLPPPEGTYVDCEAVRGRWNVVRELGNQITRSKSPTCQLYSGHRGVGKTTELLRLKTHLEGKRYKVVYFSVEDDVETQDAAYADIVFACTKNLVQTITIKERNPLVEWLRDRWGQLSDLAVTNIEFDSLSFEQQISQFSKITASVRAVPDTRCELRKRLNDSTPSLIAALNSFIAEAKQQIQPDYKDIVIIVDNLDRIAENNVDGLNNHDEIYLNRSELMRGLDCHVIYTAPIQMIYSPRVTQLEDNYGKPDVLPLVMVRAFSGRANAQGLNKFKDLICRRLAYIDPLLPDHLDTYVFDSADTRNRLCFMSGGHMRVLMQLLQKSMDQIDELPITAEAAQIAIQEQRDTYRTGISRERWELFARVHISKQMENDEDTLLLLLNRCLTEYRYYDDEMKLIQWGDVHPLLEGFSQFQTALENLQAENIGKEIADG